MQNSCEVASPPFHLPPVEADWGRQEALKKQTSTKTVFFGMVNKDSTDREYLMNDVTYRRELDGFAIELRQLAYTMPAGHEDRLIHLSERMAIRARQKQEVVDSRGA